MKTLKKTKGWSLTKLLIVLVVLLKTTNLLAQPCREVIGYFPNWQWYDRNKLVNPQTIDYSKYSILNYSFFAPQPNGTINLTDAWADENLLLGQINWAAGGYYPNTSIVDLAHNHGVKILACIGGWTLSDNFPTIAADASKRATFAQACVNLLQTYNFDGIDIDWEYPGFVDHSGTPQDKANYTLLLQAIRTAIDNYGATQGKTMLLTVAVSASPALMQHVDWAAVSPILNSINLMSYDFFGAWDSKNNHNSPLYAPLQGDSTFNIHVAVQALIHNYNVNPQKINAGLAFYGRSQTSNGTSTLFGNSTGLADNSTFQVDQGTPLYYNVIANLHLFDYHWDDDAKVPYLIGKNGLNTFLSYDNERSIGEKAKYIVDNNLQGAIIWEITGDYLETSPNSGIIAGTPLADTLNSVFCNYNPVVSSTQKNPLFSNNLLVYPNPTQGLVTLDLGSMQKNISISLINSLGQIITNYKLDLAQQVDIELEEPNGLYFIEVISDNNPATVVRVIKN